MKFRVYGEVEDTKTGQALTGAIVKLHLKREDLLQSKSAKNGFYELIVEIDDSRIESGQQLLITFEMEGYQRQENLVLATEGSFNLDAKLEAAPPLKKPFNWLPVIIAGGVVLVLLVIGVILFLIMRPKVPVIKSFSVYPNSIESGQPATLSWETTNAVEVQIDPNVGDVDVSGSREVRPSHTTIYKLIVKNEEGEEFVSDSQILIWRPKAEHKNLALDEEARASQSSRAYESVAGRAIDGNRDGNWLKGSVTHTESEWNAWWEVRLPKPAIIQEILIFNRSDCCGDRLSNFRISVREEFGKEVWGEDFEGPVGNNKLFKPNDPVEGQVVRVQIRGWNYDNKYIEGRGVLSLAEVEVWGYFKE